jgi:short-subunit dehydrogenase
MTGDNKKHALITGATSGIGYELAKLFAKDGYSLIAVARNAQMLDTTARELESISPDIHVHTIVADLFEPHAAEDLYEKVQQMHVDIDILVNNAGQGEWGKFTITDLQRELDIVQLNVVSTMTLTKLFLKDMVARNSGKILQLASSASKTPSPYLSVYAATKAFVLSLTEALQKETEDTNVTLTALQPGPTDTDFFHKAKAENSVTYKEMSFYSPEEVAKAGYEGLMNGDAKVVPGAMNKSQVYMANVIPDSGVATMMEKQMKPSSEPDGKKASDHEASKRERQTINASNGAIHGDYE